MAQNSAFCGARTNNPSMSQGSHRLEKNLNIQDSWKVLENKICLEKYLKNTQRPWKVLEFYHLQEDSTVFLRSNQYKIVVPLFGAAYAAPNKGTTILYKLS